MKYLIETDIHTAVSNFCDDMSGRGGKSGV